MGGLANICKMFGSMEVQDSDGNKVLWIWDYVKDEPRLAADMSKDEIAASEKAKWMQIKAQMKC